MRAQDPEPEGETLIHGVGYLQVVARAPIPGVVTGTLVRSRLDSCVYDGWNGPP